MKLALAAALALVAGVAFAQPPAPAPAGADAPGPDRRGRPPARRPVPTPPGRRSTWSSRPAGYAYNSQGRRDPFVSLQRPVAADRGPKTRQAGDGGFLIQEVALKGIVKTAGGGTGVAQRRASSPCSWAPTGSRIS